MTIYNTVVSGVDFVNDLTAKHVNVGKAVEDGLDTVMGIVSLVPGWGQAAGLIYFGGKGLGKLLNWW